VDLFEGPDRQEQLDNLARDWPNAKKLTIGILLHDYNNEMRRACPS
jgi:hypothetical protein